MRAQIGKLETRSREKKTEEKASREMRKVAANPRRFLLTFSYLLLFLCSKSQWMALKKEERVTKRQTMREENSRKLRSTWLLATLRFVYNE